MICSHAEHNAVIARAQGAGGAGGPSACACSRPTVWGLIAPEALTAAITPRTALCVICHASNVTGVVQPVQQLSRALKPYGVPPAGGCRTDGGHSGCITIFAGRGHDRHAGSQGTAGSARHGRAGAGAAACCPGRWWWGGTGSQSESMIQPEQLPRPLRKRHRQPAGDCGPAGWSALRAVSPGGNRAVRRFAGARPAHAPVRPARRARAGATPPRPRWALSALCPPPWTPASCATRWPTRASPCAPGCTVLPPCTSGLARCTRAPAAPAWASTTPKPMWRRWPQPSGGLLGPDRA